AIENWSGEREASRRPHRLVAQHSNGGYLTLTLPQVSSFCSSGFDHLPAPQPQLPAGRQIEMADAQAEQAQGTRDQFLFRQEKARQPVDLLRFGHRLLHGNLPREGGEIAVADLHLNGLRRELLALELRRDAGGLIAQRFLQNVPVLSVAQEGFFAAETLDRVV